LFQAARNGEVVMTTSTFDIEHTEDTFTGVGNLKLFSYRWQKTDKPVRAILVILHGLKDHAERYSELADTMNKRGFVVSAFDHRGHGRSGGKRAYVNKFDDYVADVTTFLKIEKTRYPGLPLFVFGHSMGGTMTAIAAIRKVADFQGVILSSAALVPGESISPTLIRITRLLGTTMPWLPLMKLPNEKFSREPLVVTAMANDPFIYQKNGPVRTAAQLLNAMQYIKANMEKISGPLLVLHGTGDQLTNPQGSKEVAARAVTKDKTLKLYPGLSHDLVHEPEKAQVITDIANWLEAHVPVNGPK
jgi:alpha-beta hydrolase superfamily lysophospholipase